MIDSNGISLLTASQRKGLELLASANFPPSHSNSQVSEEIYGCGESIIDRIRRVRRRVDNPSKGLKCVALKTLSVNGMKWLVRTWNSPKTRPWLPKQPRLNQLNSRLKLSTSIYLIALLCWAISEEEGGMNGWRKTLDSFSLVRKNVKRKNLDALWSFFFNLLEEKNERMPAWVSQKCGKVII